LSTSVTASSLKENILKKWQEIISSTSSITLS
jgi:hypothetical protein